MVDRPYPLSAGEPVQARETVNSHWLRYGFGTIPRTDTLPFKPPNAGQVALALARTPEELARALRLNARLNPDLIRDVLTVPEPEPPAAWPAAALRQRWPGGLPQAALAGLLASADRRIREWAIGRLPSRGRSR